MKIAIIGAGLSGCNSYSILSKMQNVQVSIFEKSRGTGGRLSTKYIEDKFIDHGTSIIKSKNPDLIKFLDKKVQDKILIKSQDSYIPTKGINKLCSSLIDKKDLIVNSKINKMQYNNGKWEIKDDKKLYKDFDFVILTIPPKQILELEIGLDKNIEEKLKQVSYYSIFSLLCYGNSSKKLDLKQLENSDGFIKTIDNSYKYDYKDFSSYILHFDDSLNKDELDLKIDKDFQIIKHFWKYAFVNKNIHEEFLFDEERKIGFCGDYFINKNIESSYLSSVKLSKKIKELVC